MLSYLSVRHTIAKALEHRGRQVSATSFEWDISGRCEKPVRVNLFARKQKGQVFHYTPGETSPPMELNMETSCRKCRWCLRQRSRLWETRAYNEYLISSRVWLGTLTLNQEARTKNLMLAHQLARKAGFDLDGADPALRSKYRHKANTAELARWLKRVRKNSDTRFRYLLCSEDHEDGTPHYHVLVFESFAHSQVSKRILQDAWRLGFTSFKLCDENGAHYVTKYLMKAASARVRASSRLGTGGRPLAIAAAARAACDPTTRLHSEEGHGTPGPEGSPVETPATGTDLNGDTVS